MLEASTLTYSTLLGEQILESGFKQINIVVCYHESIYFPSPVMQQKSQRSFKPDETEIKFENLFFGCKIFTMLSKILKKCQRLRGHFSFQSSLERWKTIFFSFGYRSKVLENFDHDYLKSKIFSGHQGICRVY